MGLDFNQELVGFIAARRGRNYFYLEDAERVRSVFDEDFGLIVTPIAYDLRVTVLPCGPFSLTDTYGFPGADGDPAKLEVATLFTSRERGAVLLRFAPRREAAPLVAKGQIITKLELSYEDTAGEVHAQHLEVAYAGPDVGEEGEVHYFTQDGVRKAVALAREVVTMQEASALYHTGDAPGGVRLLNDLTVYLAPERDALAAGDLDQEIALVETLIRNMGGTPAGASMPPPPAARPSSAQASNP